MKRTVSLVTALVALIAVSAQLRDALPANVRQFLVERATKNRLSSRDRADALVKVRPVFAPPHRVGGVEMVDAFIDYDGGDALNQAKALGVVINSEFDGFVTAQIPIDALEKVSCLPGIHVEISKLVELCTDSTLLATHAGQVIHGTQFGLKQDYDGTGVIVGIIDAGFDYRHLAFRDAGDTSRTRIVRVYDLLDTTAHPVLSANGNVMPGRVFMDEQIDTLKCDGTGTHGTHTAGIAAGMHVNGYGGMAPGADIVLCVCRNMDMLVNETEVVNCINYIYSYADSVNKPCVISLSISTLNGPHDGSDRISKAVAQKTGPGRVFVVAAGNNASRNMYSGGPSTIDKPFSFLLGYDTPGVNDDADKSYYYRSTLNDIWVRGRNERPVLTFHIYDKELRQIVWESSKITLYGRVDWTEVKDYFVPDTDVDSEGYMYAFISQNMNGKFEANCNLYNLKSTSYQVDSVDVVTSRYQIGVSVYPPKVSYPRLTDSCYVDMWTCSGVSVTPPRAILVEDVNEDGDTVVSEIEGFYAAPSNHVSIGTYAVGDSTISAGSYVARNSYVSMNYQDTIADRVSIGQIVSYSSYQAPGYGPTGEALPTVCAPGYNVVSAVSRYSYFASGSTKPTVMKTDDGSLWGAMSGTSMAAPTVAGIIAQWLQVNPELSPGNIKDIIAKTAIKDDFTQASVWGVRFGPNGKIDAMAGIKYLLPVIVTPGDVNGDGIIDVSDVTMVIGYILGMDVPGIVIEACDVDGDGLIDVSDVTRIIQIILSVV